MKLLLENWNNFINEQEEEVYIHGTRKDFAHLIVEEKNLKGSETKKFGNRLVSFAMLDTPENREAALKWAEARYGVLKNKGKGGVALVRFKARKPDWIGGKEVAWIGDLDVQEPKIVEVWDEQELQKRIKERFGKL